MEKSQEIGALSVTAAGAVLCAKADDSVNPSQDEGALC
jgi:hypothetical protein